MGHSIPFKKLDKNAKQIHPFFNKNHNILARLRFCLANFLKKDLTLHEDIENSIWNKYIRLTVNFSIISKILVSK